ncbi:MAG TPA: efflux RND transporter permease subunit [Williamwhitmania sp.]|nr:efflux RND transporter permease subunit [Williamwhitmania sp.]
MLNKILKQKAFLSFLFVALVIGGIMSYSSMGKLEDPEIPVKAAVVVTVYPGASAQEVETEVTDVLEKAIQRLDNIDNIQSRSMPGYSEITVNIKSGYESSKLPQLWDNLRRKVNDIKGDLPQGAYTPIVNDDFGDVSGIFLAMTNDGYSYKEFLNYADHVRQQLLTVPGVKRVEFFGKRTEVVNVDFNNDYFASLGINPMLIFQAFNDQGSIVNAGDFAFGGNRIRVNIGNKFQSLDEIKNFEVKLPSGARYRLGEIATVTRGFYQPLSEQIKFNGKEAISLAISMNSGGNVIVLGKAVEDKLAELSKDLPVGVEFHPIYYQHQKVEESINNFVINLIESVLVVVVVLLLAMGLRAGLLISSGLVLTILGTFIVMSAAGIELHRVSLAAIIIAMGMLVDNAIVVVDGILIDLKRGKPRKIAFVSSANKSSMPLLGATLVAILAFMPLAFNPTGVGEFLKSLFYVLAISLFLSWVLAMVQTPFMANYFYRKPRKPLTEKQTESDVYSGKFYRFYNKIIRYALWHKTMISLLTFAALIISFWAFRFVKQDFFPGVTYNQFVMEYRLPLGSDINQVSTDLDTIQHEINTWKHVSSVVSAVGRTPARYTLMRPMSGYSPSYGELIITTADKKYTDEIMQRADKYVAKRFPQAIGRARGYIAVGGDYKVEAMFSGPDEKVLRELASQAEDIFRKDPRAAFITNNWKNEAMVLSPYYSQDQARRLMVSRSDVANALAVATMGLPIGVYYDGEYRLPVMLRLNRSLNNDLSGLSNIPVWSNSASSVPLGQVVDSVDMTWETNTIMRYNGQRAIKAQCDPAVGVTANDLFNAVKPQVDAIHLPQGYRLQWLGEQKDSNEANKGLMANFPLALLLMVLIIVALFGNFKQPIIIFAIVPLAFIGVIIGFLVTGAPFGFLPIVGTLGLIGMMIKNAVVLLDEINIQVKSGKATLLAIIHSATSRVRPVMMASLTTILGMAPLVFDDIFGSMSIAIMFGLLVGTIITLVVVPVLYAIFYKVNTRNLESIG